MKKGIIICGYPGVGKSAVAGWNSCVDLESSNFSHTYGGIPQKTKMWVPRYCQAAVDLAKQGYTVLISTHLSVIQYLKNMLFIPEEVAKPVIFCPDHRWKREWVERLGERYIQFPCSKNERAMQRVVNYFEDDIFSLVNSGFPVVQPAAMDYDLKNYIYMIQKRWLDAEGGMLQMLNFAIKASDGNTTYDVGFRNGMRFAKSLIDNAEPEYEKTWEDPTMMSFEEYVEKIIKADEEDDDNAPVCIFPSNCGECYVDHRNPIGGCMHCEWAEKAYRLLQPDEIQKMFTPEIEELRRHLNENQ